MLNDTMAKALWIAVGLVAVGLTITLLWGVFSDNVNEVQNRNPTIPTQITSN